MDNEDKRCIFLCLGIIIIILITSIFFTPYHKGKIIYKYEDIDGNTGTADYCSYTDKSNLHRNGGQGTPICKVKNKVIQVKWYESNENYKSLVERWLGDE